MESGVPMRAVEPRVAVDKIVQFRPPEETEWRFGRTRNLSRSGLLFSSSAYLQVGSLVEIQLLDTDGNVCLPEPGQRRIGQVVRRLLMSWPEVVPLFAIRFLEEEPARDDHKLI